MIITKPVDLSLLQQELAAASIVVPGLGTTTTPIGPPTPPGTPDPPGVTDLHTYDTNGDITDLPPEAQPVVDAHVAPPRIVDYVGSQDVGAVVRTTDATPLVVFRFPTIPKQVYKAVLEMMAVDAVSGATRNTEARMTFKNTGTSLVQVGTTAVAYNAADAATTAWAITPSVSGTDLVISVTGAAGRTVDWTLKGSIGTYAPEGLAP